MISKRLIELTKDSFMEYEIIMKMVNVVENKVKLIVLNPSFLAYPE